MKLYIAGGETLRVDNEKCTGCGLCATVCPHRVFEMSGGKAVPVNKARCMECGACSANCAFNAVSVRVGVGCAAAVIGGMLTGGEPVCGCGSGDGKSSGCC